LTVTLEPPRTVSVVVPVFNGAATLCVCIEALLAQTYSSLIEIIVVDNNSTDRTPDLVSRYPVTLLHERALQTSYAARNRGIVCARGEIVALTDADCAPRVDWIENLVAQFSDGDLGAVVGTMADQPPANLIEALVAVMQPFAHLDRRGFKSLITGNVAVRRSVLHEVGLFDESLPTAGDIDLGWRLQLQTNWKMSEAAEAIVLHRHRGSLSGVFAQFRRYGLSEIVLTTLYQGHAGSMTRGEGARRIASQVRALLSYVLAAITRFLRWPWHHFELRYVIWPWFLFVVESGNLVGKLDGLLATGFYRHNPFRGARSIARTRTTLPHPSASRH
jgi:glycosyltransferase involved in cell wall biosynthesis